MLPDRVSNPGPLTYESGALPIALRSPAKRSLDFYCLLMVLNTSVLNPLHTGRLLHCYMLDESICHCRGCGVYFVAFILFLMGNPVSKQFRP